MAGYHVRSAPTLLRGVSPTPQFGRRGRFPFSRSGGGRPGGPRRKSRPEPQSSGDGSGARRRGTLGAHRACEAAGARGEEGTGATNPALPPTRRTREAAAANAPARPAPPVQRRPALGSWPPTPGPRPDPHRHARPEAPTGQRPRTPPPRTSYPAGRNRRLRRGG